MRSLLLSIITMCIAANSFGQVHLNKTPGSGGKADMRIDHHIWADGSSIIRINGREAFQWKKGQNPNRIVHEGDFIEVLAKPDSSGRVQFGVYYDQEWVFRLDTVLNTPEVCWSYRVENDPVRKPKASNIIGELIIGILSGLK